MTKIINKTKKVANETIERLSTESPQYFKGVRNIGAGMAISGVLLKVALAVFPATMPIGLAAVATDLVQVGLAIAGVSILTKKDK